MVLVCLFCGGSPIRPDLVGAPFLCDSYYEYVMFSLSKMQGYSVSDYYYCSRAAPNFIHGQKSITVDTTYRRLYGAKRTSPPPRRAARAWLTVVSVWDGSGKGHA
jgi:hypothetical protein